jgi:hypothetical protein
MPPMKKVYRIIPLTMLLALSGCITPPGWVLVQPPPAQEPMKPVPDNRHMQNPGSTTPSNGQPGVQGEKGPGPESSESPGTPGKTPPPAK